MITTSTGYKNAVVKNGRTWKAKIVINESEYTNFSRFEYVNTIISDSHITIGEAVTSTLDFTLDTADTIFKEGRSLEAYIGLILENQSIEWVKIGVFHITKPERDDTTLKVTAQDNMCLTTKGFFTNLSGTQKISAILTEQCNKLGFSYTGGADDASVNVSSLSGYTVREVFGILASYCGKNATIDRDGNLKLTWFSDISLNVGADKFQDPLTLAEEDTFINKLTCVINDEEQVDAGVGIGISFSNPLMTANRLSVLYSKIKGFTYRPCTVNMILGRPDMEVGDVITVTDKRGNTYKVPIMSQGISFDGGVSCKIESKGKTEIEQETEIRGNLTTRVDRTVSDLTVTKKLLADTIDAYSGEFETINTNYLEINKKLTALDAEIENLDVTELTAKVAIIETSYVSKEYVQDLYATKAEVHVLDVDLERVNTLLAGSVTAGSTQTIVLNADNTTISNALIKSAMIDSVAANKVTAGTIDASSIHFKSQTGRLDIFGETLQVKDTTRTRVQIGKDGTGDYALSQWDAQGNLMWDSRGAKAAAIKDKIIVNDMVSDNAGIEGKKINITSLVKEINDGTEVIKSSHIIVDGANQSLSVVYNTITGDISTLSTALSVEQGKISTLITDVSQAKGDVSTLQTNYSSLTQTVSGINSTVSSHSTSIDTLNNMEIGGRNLLKNSAVTADCLKNWKVTATGGAIVVKEDGFDCIKISSTASNDGMYGVTVISDKILMPNKKYTYSFMCKSNKEVMANSTSIMHFQTPSGGITHNKKNETYQHHNPIKANTWTKLICTFEVTTQCHFTPYVWYISGVTLFVRDFILVEGDKAPTWVPAPEDVDASIKTVSDKTSTLEQTVNGFDARITSATSAAGNALTKANEVSATVDGLTVRVSTAETNASTALSKTNTLEQKVTASALITTISSGISGGTALSTTKFVMDASGLHIKNGGFDISNNAGSKVFTADTAGNLSITASINAASGKIGKFTLNDGLTYTGSSTYQGMGGSVTESYSFIISPNSAHKNLGDIARDFVSGWNNPLLKVSTSANNSFELYPDGFLKTDSIKMYEGVVTGTLYFGSSQYSNNASIDSGGQIRCSNLAAPNALCGDIWWTNGNGWNLNNAMNTMHFAYSNHNSPTTGMTVTFGGAHRSYPLQIASQYNGYRLYYRNRNDDGPGWLGWTALANTSDAMTPISHNHSYTTWISSQYSTSGYIGFYSAVGGGSRKGWFGHNGGTDFHWRNETGSGNGVFLDATANGNWTHGRFAPGYGGMALGSSGSRWYRLYSSVGCDTSSDIRLKNSIRGYDTRYEAMYMDMQPVTFELNAVPGQRQGGLIAQWTKDAMTKHGITDSEFGAYNYHPEDDTYGIIYEQLTSLNMHMVQKTIKRVDAIDDELLSIKVSRQQDAQELQQELQKRDFEISQLQHRIQQLESRS